MEYFRPKNFKESLCYLGKLKGKATLIAGGTIVIPDMRTKILTPKTLVDISYMKDISYIKEEKKTIRIGGLSTISELASSNIIEKYAPILSETARQFGNPLVRNKATIGGNLANASPAADTAVPLLVLKGTVVVARHEATPRLIALENFFVSPNRTVLKPGEMIKEIIFPKPGQHARMAYIKFGMRNAMAISIVSIGVLVDIEDGARNKVRIALGAVAPRPVRAYRTETKLSENEVTTELIAECCEMVKREIEPMTDIRASAEYREWMTSLLLKRLLEQVLKGK